MESAAPDSTGTATAQAPAQPAGRVAVALPADADRVVGEIVKGGGRAVAIKADVASRADVKRLFDETTEKLGRPSISSTTPASIALRPSSR